MSERPFGSLSPQEAQAKSVETRRRNKAAQSPDLTPEQKIEAAMQRKAMGGDVNAAREYREWMKLNQATFAGGGTNGDILRLISEGSGKQGLDVLEAVIHDPSVVPFLHAHLIAYRAGNPEAVPEVTYWRYDFAEGKSVVVSSTTEGATWCSCGGRGCGVCRAMTDWHYDEMREQMKRQRASRSSGRA